MRVPGTILSAAALLLGFYQAPFDHIHPDDFDHPASSAFVHWHLHHGAPASATIVITAPTADDDAIDVGWNALSGSFIEIPFQLAVAASVQVPPVAVTSTPVPVVHRRGHDPPEVAPKSPRAPPL